MNDEVKKTFTLSPLISFRNSRKTSSYVVRTKLYRQRTLESYKYNKGLCEVCDVFLRLMHYLALLQMRILILIESLTKMVKVSCSLLASCKICNEEQLMKLLTVLDLSGITTNLRVESLMRMKNVYKNIFTAILNMRNITAFQKMHQLL